MNNTEIKQYSFSAESTMKSDVFVKMGAINDLACTGLFDDLKKESNHLLVTDKNLEKLYLQTILDGIEKSGYSVSTLVVPASEESKSFVWYERMVEKALDFGFDEHSIIFSLGGGVVNNLAGFMAATLYRGIGLVHFPTSLLAQVDAAIDFKQAINFRHGKNLIGGYYPASKIIVDPVVLRTLDIRFIRDGLAESIKHALCQDTEFLNYIVSNAIHMSDPEYLAHIVSRSIELKLEVMSPDVHDDYDETLKQYGHAIGHAVEHLSQGEIYHGEAIAIGMCVSAEIACMLGVSDQETLDLHYDTFKHVGLPTRVPEGYSLNDLWGKIRYDKHFFNGRPYMGLVRTSGVLAKPVNGLNGFFVEKEVVLDAISKNRQRRNP
jgi:3-dehydroquinate synthase